MTKKLRYSDIVGPYFYNIILKEEEKDMVDTYFTAAAHHLKRFKEAATKSDRNFHLHRHRIHLRLLMTMIYEFGDFTEAVDVSNRDLDHRETWNPDFLIIPDPNMFNLMLPDWRFGVGVAHAADHYIHDENWINYFNNCKKFVVA